MINVSPAFCINPRAVSDFFVFVPKMILVTTVPVDGLAAVAARSICIYYAHYEMTFVFFFWSKCIWARFHCINDAFQAYPWYFDAVILSWIG